MIAIDQLVRTRRRTLAIIVEEDGASRPRAAAPQAGGDRRVREGKGIVDRNQAEAGP